MPDVGVLQLKISADAGNATRSLTRLQTRLSELSQVAQSFDMSKVSTQIGDIVKYVSSKEGANTAAKNLGTLLNAITAFSKVKSIGLSADQVKQISDLKEAVSGFTLGNSGTQLNKLREALGGTWDTAQAGKAREALETLADGAKTLNTSGTAEKIKDVSSSLDNITGVSTKGVSEATDEIVDYQKVVNELGDTLKNAQVTFKEPLMGFGGGSTNIPKFENASVQSWRDEMAGIRGVNDELKQTDATSINNIGDLQRALSELGKIKGADGLMRFADGINAITAAMQSSGESYLTLGRLASAINKFKDATSGFSIPSFAKLESLARTLQENFNAENGLKRMADGINAFKTATQGMDLSNARGISAILKSMNANASQSSGTVSAMKAVSDSISTASSSNTSSGFAETSERISEVSGTAKEAYGTMENLNTLIQQTGWTAGDTSGKFREMFETWNEMRRSISLNAGSPVMRLMGGGVAPENALSTNVQTGEAWKPDWTNGENFETGFQMLRQHGEDVIEVTGTVKDELGNVISETKEASESFNGTADALDKVRSSTENAKSGIDMLGQTIEINREMADKYRAYGRTLEDVFNGIYNGKKRDVDLMSNWLHGNGTENEQLFALQHTASQFGMTLDELKAKIAEFKAAENQISQDTGAGTEVRFQKIDNAIEGVISRFSELVQNTGSLKGSLSRMFPTLSGLFNRFKQLVKYRALRAVIKQISEGFQEGTENYYYYSQAIGGTFATSMDNAASSLLTMKNSIGAAVAPLISSLIPYLQTVVNLFIEAVNYVNQFFALMNGQSTWSKATAATATAFDDISDSASGASDSINDLLADWDELNIIQSESSGSGSGTGTSSTEDYASMFKEMSSYDETIRSIVDFIKENFDEILTIVEQIGAALLLWKFSNAFNGILGTLSGLVAAGLVGAIVFEVTTLFTNKYLETKDIGWLIADLITTLVGSYFMKKILSNVLDGKFAYLAIPLTLTLNATSRIIATLGNTDVDALSQEAIISNIVSALEIGGVAGYLAYTAGATAGQAIGGGVIGAILTFSALVGLKADVNAIKNGAINADTIRAKALSALGLSIGAAAAAKLLVPNVSFAQALGFGTAAGGAATLITLSATLGIVATTQAIKSGITEDVILKDLLSSLSMAVGSLFVIKMITGTSWMTSAIRGGGIGLVTLSGLIGIQATCQVVKNNEISSETIIDDAISSLLMAGGVALIAGTLVGVGAGTALTVGGLAGLATFGALLGIQALLQLVEGKDKINWGDEVLTESEVQAFVNEKIFDVKLPVAIQLVQSKIEDSQKAGKELEEKAGEVLPVINTLLLGFDIEGSLAELDKEIFGTDGLIEKYNKNAKARKAEIEAALTLVPIKDDQGNDYSAEYLKSTSQGWENIDSIMKTLGESLSSTMHDAYTGQLKKDLSDMERESIAEITKTMLEISAIMASSQAEIQMKNTFSKGLAGYSGESIGEILTYWQEQSEASEQSMNDAYSVYITDLETQKLANEKLLEAAQKNGGEYAGKSVEYYQSEIDRIQELYNKLDEMRETSVRAAKEFYTSGEGLNMVREAILSAISISDIDWKTRDVGNENFLFSSIIESVAMNSDVNDAENKKKLTTLLQSYLREVIASSVDDPTLLKSVNTGVIKFSDLFTMEDIMPEFEKNYGKDEYDQQRLAVIRELMEELLTTSGNGTEKVEMPSIDITQPTDVEIEADNVTSDISDAIDEGMQAASGSGEVGEYDAVLEWDSEGFKEEIREDVSGMDPIDVPLNADFGADNSTSPTATSGNWFNASFSSLWNSAIENATNALNQAFGENSMFGTITINTERNDEQDTNNIAEGTKRGNVGLEAKLGQLNSTMSQLNGNVVNIAAKIGGGLTNIGASATGSLINSALNAFNMVKG